MMRVRFVLLLAVLGALIIGKPIAAQGPKPKHRDDGMSPMGHRAAKARAKALAYLKEKGLLGDEDDPNADDSVREPVVCDDNGCDTGGEEDGPNGAQSETSIAIDATGTHVVVGYNDFRGFNFSALSISGFAYSDDGGATFVDGGRLPVTPTGQFPATGELLPEVFGDPDVKYVPGGAGCQFIYSSIMVKGLGTAPTYSGEAQTMSVHRSTDCGHTWTGPFEVTAATNPTGVLSGVNARDAADKEFIDVDPETGRVLMSWSNFTATTVIPGGIEIRTTFSDNIMTATPPTWSTGVVLNPGSRNADTGSIPRFARGGSTKVYVAWGSQSRTTGLSNVRVSTSTNNGASWSAPVTLNASDFFPVDQIPGDDRIHSMPNMAVGPEGNVYVAYANNSNHDGADIVFQRSTDGGVSFSPAALLNARPGADRSQWFPTVAADTNGRVYVTYYDQGVASSGDLTQVRFSYSDDGGVTWSAPSALMSAGCRGLATSPRDCRPFHAGYGNDTSQPNLGDYIGSTTFNGRLFAAWAASPPQVSFVDGQPDPTGFYNAPDFYVNAVTTGTPSLSLGDVASTDSGGNGFIDPGDKVSLTLPLFNYVTAGSAQTYAGVTGALTTTTPGVSIVAGSASYPNIAPGATESNAAPFVVQVDQSFVAGTPIEFTLVASTSQGSTTLLFSRFTGTPIATTIFSEDFNGVAAGTLPAGWARIHAGGNNTVPWTTSSTFCGATSNGLFHANANDGLAGNHTRFERVSSPNITVPANAQYVTLDFDVCYDTEDDPSFNVLAYDGALLRITDFTPGHVARANLVEAFADVITTGTNFHFPKHNPRSSNANYFQDMSMWAGFSNGFQHVHMQLPGMAGTIVALRPDYTQDSIGTCANVRANHSCGVLIDNIVMKSVVSATTVTTATAISSSLNPSDLGASVTFTATVTAGSPVTTGTVTFRDGATVLASGVALDASGQASFTTSALASGTHTISASYDDGTHFASSNASLMQAVDVQPSFVINDVGIAEGSLGSTPALVFTVTLSAPTHALTASVHFATANGSAQAPGDYPTAGGTLLFAPGTTTGTITVLLNGDNVIEPNETFAVNLTTPVNATISDAQGIATIVNDDTVATTLAAISAQLGECAGGLNSGQCQALLTRIAAAQRSLGGGRTSDAVHALAQFLDEVGNFSRSVPGAGTPPRLDAATAALWSAEAQSVIAALGS